MVEGGKETLPSFTRSALLHSLLFAPIDTTPKPVSRHDCVDYPDAATLLLQVTAGPDQKAADTTARIEIPLRCPSTCGIPVARASPRLPRYSWESTAPPVRCLPRLVLFVGHHGESYVPSLSPLASIQRITNQIPFTLSSLFRSFNLSIFHSFTLSLFQSFTPSLVPSFLCNLASLR